MNAVYLQSRLKLALPALVALQALMIAHILIYLVGGAAEFSLWQRVMLWASVALGGALALLSLHEERLQWLWGRLGYKWVGGALLFLFALALSPLPDAVVPHLIHTHVMLTFVASFALLYVRLYDGIGRVKVSAVGMPVAVVAVLLICAVRIYGLSVYPFIDWQDEAWTMAWTQAFMRTGTFSDPTLQGLGDAYYAYPRFYLGLAAWFQMVGVGLWQGRLFGFLLIVPLIAFSALAARNLFGSRAAVFTALFMFSSAIVMSAARIRHDIGLAICVAASLWLYSEALKGNRPWLHLLAGVVVAWGMFSHYHAAGFGAALLVGLYLPRYIAQLRTTKNPIPEAGVWLFGVGGLLGAASVVLLQMIPDDLPGFLSALQRQSKYSDDGGQFLVAFFGNFITIGFFSIFDLLLISAGVGLALYRRRQNDISLVLIVIISHVLLAVMASGAIYYYILPLTPIYGMLVATLFDTSERSRLPKDQPSGINSSRAVVLFAFLLIPSLGYTLSQPLQHALHGRPTELPPPPAAQWVLDNIPTDSVIAGDLRYYLWLHEYAFASHLIPDFLYPSNLATLTTAETIWRAVEMDVLIVDTGLSRSYKFFRPLVTSDFLPAEGYRETAQFDAPNNTTTIYTRIG